MTDLTGAIQKAIFAKLTAVSGLPIVVTEVPTTSVGAQEVASYPFTLLGDDQVTDVGGKGEQFEQHDVAVHVCMQSVPKLTVRAAQERVRATLHNQPIAAAGAILSNPVQTAMNTPLLDDGATYVGVQIFRVFAQPAG